MGAEPELAVMTGSDNNDDSEPTGGQEEQTGCHEAQQQAKQESRGLAGGRSFTLSKLVQAARKSFELNPREEVDPNAPPPTMRRYQTQALWLDHQDGMHVAHAPPPGMEDPPIPPESEEDEHEYVEHVELKAVSLAGLREFVKSHNIKPNMTTHQVVRSIIIPATMGRANCALVDLDALRRHALPAMDSPGAAAARKAAGPLPPYTRMPKSRTVTGLKRRAPYYYIVHAWSRPFLEMVDLVEAHLAGRPADHTYIWLDVFAVPQVSPDHSGFIQEIQRAIWYATSTLACFDPAATVLTRLWCLYEIFYTFISKQCAHALVALTTAPLTMAHRTALYRRINAAKAKCSVKEDKKKLTEHVHGYTRRGMPAINNYIRSGLILPPYDHAGVYLPAGYEEKTGMLRCMPCMAPPPPPPPPQVPEHVAMVPEVAEPSIRKMAPGFEGLGGIGSCGLGHQEERPLRLVLGACNIPHPKKTKTGGEDAFFISPAGRGALGVADGVGSWSADDGVDPAVYSKDLMRAAASSLEASGGRIGARMALADAHLAVKHAGSSTGTVGVVLPDSNTLQLINVGDSGMRLVRGGKLAMATRPQAHAHNMPYQLASPDEPVCDTDSLVQGDVYNIPLEVGDIIIMATDGMYDNVWPEAMLDIVNKAMIAVEEDAQLAAGLGGSSAGGLLPAAGSVGDSGLAADAEVTMSAAPVTTTTTTTLSGDAPPHRKPIVGPVVVAAAPTGGQRVSEQEDGIGKHAPVAGDAGESVRADVSSQPLPPSLTSARAAALARTLARTAAANMLRRDVRSPFAVELSKQPTATPEFRTNPRGGKPDDVTVVVAVVVEADEASLERLQMAALNMGRGSVTAVSEAASGRLPASRAASGRLSSLPL